MDGLWSSPDLAALHRAGRRSTARRWRCRRAGGAPGPAAADASRTGCGATRKGQSRRNISAHYDLGNDFYRLFLDETMTYSSAVFASPDQSLADAQREQVPAHRRRRRASRPGQHVLEIGTGWGGFALYAAGELGCRVTSITISQEQHDLARERVARGRARRTASTSSCATTATSRARTTRSCRSRCSRRSARSTSRRSSRTCDRGARAGRPAEPPGRSRSRTPPTSASSAAPTGSRRTSSRAACCPSLAVIERVDPRTPGC